MKSAPFGDYDEYTAIAVSNDTAVAHVVELTNKFIELLRSIDIVRADLDQMEAEARALSDVLIPEAMDDAGLAEFKTAAGERVIVKEIIRANIPAHLMHEASEWLEAHDGGGLIKTVVSTTVARDNHEMVATIVDAIAKMGATVDRKDSVHWGTLTSWVKERLVAGLPIDATLLGVMIGRKAEIKRGKR